DSSIAQVADLVRNRGLLVFEYYRLDRSIATMDINSIENGNLGILDSMTKIRACLLLARMHEHLGNYNKCIEVATFGLKIAGMAVGPKKAIKDILKRIQHL